MTGYKVKVSVFKEDLEETSIDILLCKVLEADVQKITDKNVRIKAKVEKRKKAKGEKGFRIADKVDYAMHTYAEYGIELDLTSGGAKAPPAADTGNPWVARIGMQGARPSSQAAFLIGHADLL